jgi:hypothetical protein
MHLDVLFDEEGNYDADATNVKFQAIANGAPV